VLAIKQTLYRVGGGSPVVAALVRAAESGKQVTALVELRARFDEERNIGWARRLEEAGAHVIYGLRGLKTHCKALLIVRREQDGIRRYLHLGTGNYNVTTARVYSDFGILTTDEALGRDVGALFNVLTGYSEPPAWEKIEISPTGLRGRLLRLIDREREHAARGEEARIIGKLNALVDATMIAALYDASKAGVKVDLVVRGICCLRPGLEGVSENIRVRSIVGRFLEHARALYFRNGGAHEVYLSSADWMPRNLDRRVELLFPVEERELADLVLRILELQLTDDVKARELGKDGRWSRVPEGERRTNSQKATYDLLRRLGRGTPRREQRFVPVRGRRAAKRTVTAGESTVPEARTPAEARPVRRARRR
jgi:polyphosphate kinase